MAKIKSHTDLPQSKKLAEILPLESADMAWCNNSIRGVNYTDEYSANLYTVKEMQECFDEALKGWDKYWKLIPCWSLSALLDVLPKIINNETLFIETSAVLWHIGYRNIYIARASNPIDACYEMILMLHDNNLL